jgi:glycosyltransferase involved in cell wall biosynthesis
LSYKASKVKSPHLKNKKVIVTTDVMFWNRAAGSHQRIFEIIKYLERQQINIIIYFVGFLGKKDLNNFYKEFSNIKIIKFNSPKVYLKKAVKKALAMFKVNVSNMKKPTQKSKIIKDFYSERYLDKFQKVLKQERPDFIISEYIRTAYLCINSKDLISNKITTIIDTHDVIHERCEMFLKNKLEPEILIAKEEETNILNNYDCIMAIQDKDAKAFRQLLPGKKVITVMHKPVLEKLAFKDTNEVNLMFIGGDSQHNIEAIKWFLENVWVNLSKSYGDRVRLSIYGKVCQCIEENKFSNIYLNGFIKDLKKIYDESDIIINPTFSGSGLKIKNVESICYGKQLVTTKVGAEGLEDGINKAFYVFETDIDFIKGLGSLIESNNLRKELGNNAYNYALSKFDDSVIYKEFYNILGF